MHGLINRRSFLKLGCLIGSAAASSILFPFRSFSKQSIPSFHRVDVHHHILPPVYLSELSKKGITSGGGVPFPYWNVNMALDVMDRNGIASAITSVPSIGDNIHDNSFSPILARKCNEFSADLIEKHPRRFGAFAALPLSDITAALKETDYAFEQLNLDGILLQSNVGGVYPGDIKFDELFAELNRRKAIVHIHPADPPGRNQTGLNFPTSLIEFVFDTTRAITNLIYSGTLEKYQDIRFIVSHAGGTAPYLAQRISLLQYQPGMEEKVPQGVFTHLKHLYYDTALSASPYALRSLQELAGPAHILFGSDYPFAPDYLTSASITGLKQYDGFDTSQLVEVEQGNALTLFSRIK